MLSFEAAMKKIGKQMGKNKMNDAMGGAFFPKGDVSVEWALSIIYDKGLKSIGSKLDTLCDRQFKQERAKRRKKKYGGE